MNMFFLVFGLWCFVGMFRGTFPSYLLLGESWKTSWVSCGLFLAIISASSTLSGSVPSSPSGCMKAHLPDLSTLSSLAQTLFCVFHCHFPFCFWYGDFPMISLGVNAFTFSLVSYSLQLMGCGFYNIGHILCEFSNISSIYRVLHPYHHLVWERFYRFPECFCMIP